MTDVIELFRHMKERLGMYFPPQSAKYETVTAFIDGYNYATNRWLLEGFREWLEMKFANRYPFAWQDIIVLNAFPNAFQSSLSPVRYCFTDERLAINTMFDFLEEFLLIKNDRSRGLRWIYMQYEEWLKEWDKRINLEWESMKDMEDDGEES